MSARGTTLPAGLFGVQTNTSFTAGVSAASVASTSSVKSGRSGASITPASWMRAHTAYMPKVGGWIRIASCPARQNARTSRSIASSLPRPASNCSRRTPYKRASTSTSAVGCGSG